jgi:hypothetical protein
LAVTRIATYQIPIALIPAIVLIPIVRWSRCGRRHYYRAVPWRAFVWPVVLRGLRVPSPLAKIAGALCRRWGACAMGRPPFPGCTRARLLASRLYWELSTSRGLTDRRVKKATPEQIGAYPACRVVRNWSGWRSQFRSRCRAFACQRHLVRIEFGEIEEAFCGDGVAALTEVDVIEKGQRPR